MDQWGGSFWLLPSGSSWASRPAETNRALALSLGGLLMAAGLLAQLLPEGSSQNDPLP
ncbi:MAG: GIVxVP protein [Cyanobium sp.]